MSHEGIREIHENLHLIKITCYTHKPAHNISTDARQNAWYCVASLML